MRTGVSSCPGIPKDKYRERRRVAVPYKNVVQSYGGQWIDPANPGGGRVLDFVALARDQAANRLEALEGTVTPPPVTAGWSTTEPSRRWPSSSPSSPNNSCGPALPVRVSPGLTASWSP